jgi:hypothetical protein
MAVVVGNRPAGAGLIWYNHPVGRRMKAPSFPAGAIPAHLKTYTDKFIAEQEACKIKGGFAPRYGKIQSSRNACIGKKLATKAETVARYAVVKKKGKRKEELA